MTLDDQTAYAVAVFAQSIDPALNPWAVNDAISEAAVLAVTSLQ